MPKIGDFGETQDVAVIVLVDNRADLIVKPTDMVKHYTLLFIPRMRPRFNSGR